MIQELSLQKDTFKMRLSNVKPPSSIIALIANFDTSGAKTPFLTIFWPDTIIRIRIPCLKSHRSLNVPNLVSGRIIRISNRHSNQCRPEESLRIDALWRSGLFEKLWPFYTSTLTFQTPIRRQRAFHY